MSAAPQPAAVLPDPEPRPVQNLIISVDDHCVEPPDAFAGRMPSRLAEDAPRVVETDEGTQVWLIEGKVQPNIGLSAVVGQPPEKWNREPTRFEQMRRGCWDIDERIRDMDINGVYASICFPSGITGFAGTRFAELRSRDLGTACVRAWNDWQLEGWCGPYPDRMIPIQIADLADLENAAKEVRRNAERGFKAISLPDIPEYVGCPSLAGPEWDPLLTACAETGTVVCLHVGSGGRLIDHGLSAGKPNELSTVLFPAAALLAASHWLFAGIPARFPNIRIALSEGGLGWVPMLLDRLDFVAKHSARGYSDWRADDLTPAEALQRNFYFCTLDDPSTICLYERIGVDKIMVESDYPHADSTWPDTQDVVASLLAEIPDDARRAITHGNAARLFRHPLPQGY